MKISAQWEVNTKKNDAVRGIGLNSSGSMKSESTSFLIADEVPRESVDIDKTDKQSDYVQTLKDSFVKAYKAMDRELKMYTNIDCFCSGTTAVTLVKQVSLTAFQIVSNYDFDHKSYDMILYRAKIL